MIAVGAVEPRRGCESGGSGSNYFSSAAAFAASLKLDSSHRGSGAGLKGACAGDQPKPRQRVGMDAIRVGAVEPRRGCESGGSGSNYFSSAAAFAASLKLDSSHRGSGAGL